MEAYFKAQAGLHPAMRPRDALKACYQAAFGAEHMIADPASARRYLHEEMRACPADAALPLTEALSPDTCRVNLSAWKASGLPESLPAEVFLRSCAPRTDGMERFSSCLRVVDRLAAAGELPFSAADWQAGKREYLDEGVRPVHHSDAYRAAEHPAYRVVSFRYARALRLLAALGGDRLQIIALDGRCASGKSTLADDLASLAGASTVHMDDFFLPAALRTPERLGAPGGNVHIERFRDEVLPGLRGGAAFAYRRFDCGKMALDGLRDVPASDLYIVEGAYSCHPALGAYMTLRAFSDIDPETQRARILRREGKAGLERFLTRWIPMEERYIAAFGIREKADLILPAQAQPGGW